MLRVQAFEFEDLGLRVRGFRLSALRVLAFEFENWCSWFRLWGLGWGLGFEVYGLRFRVWGLGFGVQGLGFGVYSRLRVSGGCLRVELALGQLDQLCLALLQQVPNP